MGAFETSFRDQIRNVLDGRTADGRALHGLWKLPNMERFRDIRQSVMELSYWTLCRAKDQHRAREDVRTFVIWSTAAHLWRLTRMGHTLPHASREVSWMSLLMLEKPDFIATCPFARALMPELLPPDQPKDRSRIRKGALKIPHICQTQWRVHDHDPATDIFDTRYSVCRYFIPEHFLANPYLASKWTSHIAAMEQGADADHTYWVQVAQGERMVFAFFTQGNCKANFESHNGHLERLMVIEPADDAEYDLLAYALSHLRHLHGDIFRLTPQPHNPAILRLLATRERHAQSLKEMMDRAPTTRQGVPAEAPPPPRSKATTDTWLAYAAILLLLSYIIPVLIILAPDLARSYVHVWRVVLAIEPDCEYPSIGRNRSRIDCLSSKPTGTQDKRIPIPTRETRQ